MKSMAEQLAPVRKQVVRNRVMPQLSTLSTAVLRRMLTDDRTGVKQYRTRIYAELNTRRRQN